MTSAPLLRTLTGCSSVVLPPTQDTAQASLPPPTADLPGLSALSGLHTPLSWSLAVLMLPGCNAVLTMKSWQFPSSYSPARISFELQNLWTQMSTRHLCLNIPWVFQRNRYQIEHVFPQCPLSMLFASSAYLREWHHPSAGRKPLFPPILDLYHTDSELPFSLLSSSLEGELCLLHGGISRTQHCT